MPKYIFVANEIIPINRGYGNWQIAIYNPSKILPDIKGYLLITKDHHTVFQDANLKVTLRNVPSQNVAWVDLVPE
jgi:hypothetical protein